MQKSKSTPCKNCVNAIYNGITQTGCRLGIFEKYQKYGIEILEAFDEEKEFFILKDKTCHFKFNKPYQDWTNYDWKVFRENTTLSYSAIINLTNKDASFLKQELHKILMLASLPKEIIVVSPFTKRPHPTMVRKCLEYIVDKKCRWRVSHPYTMNFTETIDSLVHHFIKTSFYLITDTYSEKLNEFLNTITEMVLYGNMPIGYAKHNKTQAVLFNTKIHKMFNGNSKENLVSKLENECPETILQL